MENKTEACLVCGADLKYHTTAREMECRYCHRTFMSKTECINGHYVCDECHSNPAMMDIRNFCVASKSLNPIEIATGLMKLPSVHMHGPEHHTLVGSALLTAYKNAGGKLDSLDDALAEMANRGGKVPGGACGFWGACGAGISSGMFVSIITGSTPLSRKPWGMSNVMTSRSLQAIGAIDGPRCCKRNTYLALLQAADFIKETLDIEMEIPSTIICNFSSHNKQCIGERCPFNKSMTESLKKHKEAEDKCI